MKESYCIAQPRCVVRSKHHRTEAPLFFYVVQKELYKQVRIKLKLQYALLS